MCRSTSGWLSHKRVTVIGPLPHDGVGRMVRDLALLIRVMNLSLYDVR